MMRQQFQLTTFLNMILGAVAMRLLTKMLVEDESVKQEQRY